MAFLIGKYPRPVNLPCIPGLEATGEVVASGGGEIADSLLNCRVHAMCDDSSDGAWAEYMISPVNYVTELPAQANYVEYANLLNYYSAQMIVEAA